MLAGCSVRANLLKSEPYAKLLVKNFDYLYHDGEFDFPSQLQQAKVVSEFCSLHEKALRGNHLVSNKSFKIYDDIPSMIKRKIKDFPEIREWECCHEAIADSGNFRRNFCQEKIEEYFIEAKIANPKNRLFYADYYRDFRKWESTYSMLGRSLGKGVPIDGLSVQLMSNLVVPVLDNPLSLNLKVAEKWINRIKKDFPEIEIIAPETVVWQPESFWSKFELSKKCNNRKELIRKYAVGLLLKPYNIEFLQYQGYKLIVEMALRTGISMLGFWTVSDACPWNWIDNSNRQKSGLWDENFQPKPAASVLDLF